MGTDSPRGDLAAYIIDECFAPWAKDRAQLEEKWQRNLDAFNSCSASAWKKHEGEGWRSTTSLSITKMKVIAAYSMIIDMIMQGGRIPFALETSPLQRDQYDQMPDEARQNLEDRSERAEAQIRTQLDDCNADRELMANILSNAIYGETFAKRTVHEVTREDFRAVSMAPQGMPDPQGQFVRYERVDSSTVCPAWNYISVWDVFRDLEDDDLQACRGVIHREYMSAYELRKYLDKPCFLPANIGRCIRDAIKNDSGASSESKTSLPPHLRDLQNRYKNIRYLEFWGRVPRRIAEEFEAGMDSDEVPAQSLDDQANHDGDEIEVLVCLANDEVVRYVRREPGKRPFYRAVWEMNLDGIGGTGIPDNLDQIQAVLNGAIRGFEDNTRLAGDIILAVKEDLIEGKGLQITPGEKLRLADNVNSVHEAIQQFIVQPVGEAYLSVIRLFQQFADLASMVPQIVQGQRPEKSSDTAYELSQLLENAGKYLGGVVRNLDEGLIEPIVGDFYRYNMMNPDSDPQAKGPFKVKAQGFTSFQARVIRLQSLMRFMSMALGNEFMAPEVRVREPMEEMAKGMDLDPGQVLKSEEEKKQDALNAERTRQQAKAEMAEQEAMKHRQEMEKMTLAHAHSMEETGAKIQGEDAKAKNSDRRKAAQDLLVGGMIPPTPPAGGVAA